MVEKIVNSLEIRGFYKALDIHDRQKMRRASLSLLMQMLEAESYSMFSLSWYS